MRILITGIGGLIGSHLAPALAAAGHDVAGSLRQPDRADPALRAFELHAWRLGEPPPEAMLADRDLLIHAAYAAGKANERLNVEGTGALRRAATDAGVARQMLLSSYSASPRAVSAYGRMKHALEREFLEHGLEVARPGLVLGPGGLFREMVGWLRRWPIVALPDGGRRPVAVIGHTDLCRCLVRMVDAPSANPMNLCYGQRPALGDLLRATARASGLRRWFVPFPTMAILLPMQALAKLGVHLPVDTESLRAYRAGTAEEHGTDFARFGFAEPDLDEVVRDAI
jgi:nucleoside-diphosphate-sugar epimerase